MKNKIFAVSCIIIIAGYGFLFLRSVPKIDPVHSGYSVLCDNNATDAGGFAGFGEIPANVVSPVDTSGRTPREWSYKITDEAWDVDAKVICNGTITATGAEAMQQASDLYQTIKTNLNDPQVVVASSKPANYTVEMTRPAYDPSWAVYIFKIISLIGLLALAFVFTR